jgi:RNA polymerase sigma-70 factor (ECF subfamily)
MKARRLTMMVPVQHFLNDIEAAIPALRRYAHALTRNLDAADDLVQDCVERAIRKRGLFAPRGEIRPWLFRILLNLYRNGLRHNRRHGTVPLDEATMDVATPAAQPGRIALAEMARALDRLPLEQREALLLVVLDGVSYAEAAQILGVPLGTLMSRLGRARAALRVLTGTPGELRLRTVK